MKMDFLLFSVICICIYLEKMKDAFYRKLQKATHKLKQTHPNNKNSKMYNRYEEIANNLKVTG